MTDEMNKNLENEELDPEKLEGVSGGLMVNCGENCDYRVVDDKTGEKLDSSRWFPGRAISIAEKT